MLALRVRTSRLLSALALSATALVLSACGGGGSDSSTAYVRVVNATLTHPSLDFQVNSSTAATALTYDVATGYTTPPTGATLTFNDTGSGTTLATTVPSLGANSHYTLIAYESNDTVQTALVSEDSATPTSGTILLRVLDLSTDAGKLDVYITDPGTDLASISTPSATVSASSATSFISFNAGTYRVRVTGSGNKSDLRLDIPSVTFTSQQRGTIVLTPTAGGALLNGAVVNEQATYTGVRNTNARVRLAAAVSGNATVAATATSGTSSVVVDSGSVSPAFGYYTLVPASATLNITVNGQTVAAPSTALQAGKDSTLFVYGAPTAATASLLSDDNRVPSDSSTVKLRLINGVTGSTGTLALTANSSLVASGIAAGSASSYVAVTGSTTAMNLTLTSSAVPGVLLQDTSNVLNLKGVYTIFANGPVTAPQLLIR